MKDWVERSGRLIDLDDLPLEEVQIDDSGGSIGALVRMADLADHAEFRRRYPVAAEALLASASPQVRNMATIGGNLLQRTRCGYSRDVGSPRKKREPGSGCSAIPGEHRRLAILGGSNQCIATHPSDLAVTLAALDAAVELCGAAGASKRFLRPAGRCAGVGNGMAPGELITAIRLLPASSRIT
jgi:xanthine dehydrogenase YagS FAD-binding subunit